MNCPTDGRACQHPGKNCVCRFDGVCRYTATVNVEHDVGGTAELFSVTPAQVRARVASIRAGVSATLFFEFVNGGSILAAGVDDINHVASCRDAFDRWPKRDTITWEALTAALFELRQRIHPS